MTTSRRIIGILLLVPTPLLLVLTIWSSGLLRIVTEPQILGSFSKITLQKLPDFLDQTQDMLIRAHSIKDKRTLNWLEALRKAKVKPSKLFRETGLQAWSQAEMASLVGKLQQIFKGESVSEDLSVDTTQLKQLLNAPRVDQLIKQLFMALPSCSAGELIEWRVYQISRAPKKKLPPACRPSALLLPSIMRSKRNSIYRMPSTWMLVPPSQIKELTQTFQAVRALPWLLFLIPGLLIFLGAGIGGRGLRGFVGWTGAAFAAGGLLALSTPFFLKDVLLKALLLQPWEQSIQTHLPVPQPFLHNWLFEHLLPFFRASTAPIFSSVETVGLYVTLAGVLAFGVSFFLSAPANKE